MKAKVFLDEGFFDLIEDKIKEHNSNKQNLSNIENYILQDENINKLNRILLYSSINAKLSQKKFLKYFKKSDPVFQVESYEELAIITAIRNNKFENIDDFDFNCNGSLYFLNLINKETEDISKKYNVLCVSKDFDFSKKIVPNSIVSEKIDENMKGIEYLKHMCRNVIIIDPYLFQDTDNKSMKIPNLLKFLKILYFDNKNVKCNLSVVCNNPENNSIIQKKIDEIKTGMNNPDLNVSVFAFYKIEKPFGNDRYFITDYCKGNYLHLFDRKTEINASFFYDIQNTEASDRLYIRTNEILIELKKLYQKQSDSVGNIQIKFGNILDNQLFDELV